MTNSEKKWFQINSALIAHSLTSTLKTKVYLNDFYH